MPNGGGDCCLTCWFNAKNKGEAGYQHIADLEPAYCVIRDFAIANPPYTYCSNHPHKSPERITVPIGPVFIGDSSGKRERLLESPDTEVIRQYLLHLLQNIAEEPPELYPAGASRDEVVIWQVGEFRDVRAISDLERICAFNRQPAKQTWASRNQQRTILLAQKALIKITGQQKQQK